jgi:hypothetical protein
MPWVKTILAGLRSGCGDPASFKGKAGENVGGEGAGGGGVCFSVDSGEKIIREVSWFGLAPFFFFLRATRLRSGNRVDMWFNR